MAQRVGGETSDSHGERGGVHGRTRYISYDSAVGRVTYELKKEGVGVLAEVDVKATITEELDVDFRRYVVLGACNPNLAYRAPGAKPYIGLLLQCNVVVQEAADGGVIASIADPRAMFALVAKADVAPVVEQANTRLRRVLVAMASEEMD